MQVKITSSMTFTRLVVLEIRAKLMIVIIAGLKYARNREHRRKRIAKRSYGLSGIAKQRKFQNIAKMSSSRYATPMWMSVAIRDELNI